MKQTFLVAITFILAVFLATGTAHSLLMGETVEYQYFFPSLSDPYSNAANGNYVVGPGVEVPNIVDGRGTLDISDTNLYFDFTETASFTPSSFNGFRITDIFGTIPDFTSVSINPVTNMAGFNSSLITFDADHIWVNWTTLPFNSDTIVSLDINSVPEPATLILLGSGLAALGFVRRFTR